MRVARPSRTSARVSSHLHDASMLSWPSPLDTNNSTTAIQPPLISETMPTSKTTTTRSKAAKAAAADDSLKKGKSADRSKTTSTAAAAKNSKNKSSVSSGVTTTSSSSSRGKVTAKGKADRVVKKEGKAKRARALLDLNVDDANNAKNIINNVSTDGEEEVSGSTRGRTLRARKKVRYDDDGSVSGDDGQVSVDISFSLLMITLILYRIFLPPAYRVP